MSSSLTVRHRFLCLTFVAVLSYPLFGSAQENNASANTLPLAEALPQHIAIISRWILDEQSGTRKDSVGSNDLNDQNTVESAAGQFGAKAADFERDDAEYLDVSDAVQNGLDLDGNVTFSFWLKSEDAQSGTDIRTLITKYSGSEDRSYFLYHIQEAGQHEFDLGFNSSGQRGGDGHAHLTYTMPVGEWFHVVITHDAMNGGATVLYINGVQQAISRTGKTSVFDGGADFKLGSNNEGGANWDGLMQDTIIWNEPLSPEDAGALYAAYQGGEVEEEETEQESEDIKLLESHLLGTWTPEDFDGTEETAIYVGNVDWFDGDKEWSIRAIFSVPDTVGQYPIAAKWLTRDVSRQFAIDIHEGQLGVYLGTGKNTQTTTRAKIEAGVRYDLVVNKTKEGIAIFLNGELKAESRNDTMQAKNTEPFVIGGITVNGAVQSVMKGTIDELTVFGRALKAGEPKILASGGTIVLVNEVGEVVKQRERTLEERVGKIGVTLTEEGGKFLLRAERPNAVLVIQDASLGLLNGFTATPGPLTQMRVRVYGKRADGTEMLIHDEYKPSEAEVGWYIPEEIVGVSRVVFGNVPSKYGNRQPNGSISNLRVLHDRASQSVAAPNTRPWESVLLPQCFSSDEEANAFLDSLERMRAQFAKTIPNPYIINLSGVLLVLEMDNPEYFDIEAEVDRRMANFQGSYHDEMEQRSYLRNFLTRNRGFVLDEIENNIKKHTNNVGVILSEFSKALHRYGGDTEQAATYIETELFADSKPSRMLRGAVGIQEPPLFSYMPTSVRAIVELGRKHTEDLLALGAFINRARTRANILCENDLRNFLEDIKKKDGWQNWFDSIPAEAQRAFRMAYKDGLYWKGEKPKEELVVGEVLVMLLEAGKFSRAQFLAEEFGADAEKGISLAMSIQVGTDELEESRWYRGLSKVIDQSPWQILNQQNTQERRAERIERRFGILKGHDQEKRYGVYLSRLRKRMEARGVAELLERLSDGSGTLDPLHIEEASLAVAEDTVNEVISTLEEVQVSLKQAKKDAAFLSPEYKQLGEATEVLFDAMDELVGFEVSDGARRLPITRSSADSAMLRDGSKLAKDLRWAGELLSIGMTVNTFAETFHDSLEEGAPPDVAFTRSVDSIALEVAIDGVLTVAGAGTFLGVVAVPAIEDAIHQMYYCLVKFDLDVCSQPPELTIEIVKQLRNLRGE